jgi:alpha-tubulin suppressor-like RCC1 family protein
MDMTQWMAVVREAVETLKAKELERKGEREHVMEGYLTKLAMQSGRNWKKRWFVLKNGRISYYEDRPNPGTNVKPKGVMELTADTSVLVFKDQQSTKPNTFEVTAKKLVLTVSADSLQSLIEWVDALDRHILAKAGFTGEGAIEVSKWMRSLGVQEYCRRMIDMGLDEMATVWDKKVEELQKLAEDADMSRVEQDMFNEGVRVLKKGKRPATHKKEKKVVETKVAAVLFDMNPPARGKMTRLYTWGDSTNSQLGLVQARTGSNVHTPTFVDALKGKTEPAYIACGTAAMGCITNTPEANLFTWGTGPLGLGDKITTARPFMVTALRDVPVRSLACGGSHMVCLSQDGQVFTWGAGDMGQLGLGEDVQGCDIPQLVPGVGPKSGGAIIHCAAGAEHTVVISNQGSVYAFGNAGKGQLGVPASGAVFTPTKVKTLEGHPIGQVACGDEFTLAVLKSGAGAFWFGAVRGKTVLAPEKIDRFTSRVISQCAAGGKTGMFLVGLEKDTATGEYGTDASVYSFGSDVYVHGHADDEVKLKPTLVEGLEGHGAIQVAVSSTHAACLCSDGRLLMWGHDDSGQLGSSYMVSIKRPTEAIRVSGYRYTNVALGDSFTAATAVEDASVLNPDVPSGEPCPAPPPPEEALEAMNAEGEDLQKMLDQFATFAHRYDLEQEMDGIIAPPEVPDEDEDLDSLVPPPPPPPEEKPTKTGGVRVLAPGSKDLGNGWLSHTDKVSGKTFYEHPVSGKVQWSKPSGV